MTDLPHAQESFFRVLHPFYPITDSPLPAAQWASLILDVFRHTTDQYILELEFIGCISFFVEVSKNPKQISTYWQFPASQFPSEWSLDQCVTQETDHENTLFLRWNPSVDDQYGLPEFLDAILKPQLAELLQLPILLNVREKHRRSHMYSSSIQELALFSSLEEHMHGYLMKEEIDTHKETSFLRCAEQIITKIEEATTRKEAHYELLKSVLLEELSNVRKIRSTLSLRIEVAVCPAFGLINRV